MVKKAYNDYMKRQCADIRLYIDNNHIIHTWIESDLDGCDSHSYSLTWELAQGVVFSMPRNPESHCTHLTNRE